MSSVSGAERIQRRHFAHRRVRLCGRAVYESEYSQYYHESGILIISDEGGHSYLDKAKEQVQSRGGQISVYDDASRIREAHYEFASGTLQECEGYLKIRSGWVDSAEAVRHLASKCSVLGVSFITSTRGSVDSLLFDGMRVVGVNVKEDPPLLAI